MDDMTFCERLSKARKARRWSQKDVAEAVGVSHQAIGSYERGLSEPSISTLVRLCTVLDVSADDLLGVPDTTEKKKTRYLLKTLEIVQKIVTEM